MNERMPGVEDLAPLSDAARSWACPQRDESGIEDLAVRTDAKAVRFCYVPTCKAPEIEMLDRLDAGAVEIEVLDARGAGVEGGRICMLCSGCQVSDAEDLGASSVGAEGARICCVGTCGFSEPAVQELDVRGGEADGHLYASCLDGASLEVEDLEQRSGTTRFCYIPTCKGPEVGAA